MRLNASPRAVPLAARSSSMDFVSPAAPEGGAFASAGTLLRRLLLGAASAGLILGAGLAANAGSPSGQGSAGDHGKRAAADHGQADSDTSSGDRGKSSGGHGGKHWTYEGASGPERWGDMSPEFRTCKTGTIQSPIDAAAPMGQSTQAIEFDYRLNPLTILHNGHTVQVNYAPGSGITVGGKRYELLQFHFHTPSEHAIDGRRAPMEVHFVHKSADGQLAVVGVMIETGAENLAMGEIWRHLPKSAAPAKTYRRVLVNARDLLPRDTGYYRYVGSLTTPPCSEGVQWFLIKQPIQVKRQLVEQFAKAVGENARPLQALNNRLLLAPSVSN